MDLDLDVVRRRNGEVEILDLDEFELHRRQFGYPPDLTRAVDHAAEELADALSEHQAPFRLTPDVPTLPRTPDAG